MRFAELVATSSAVAATSSRKEKSERLAEFLRNLADDEIRPAVAFLVGDSPEGRVGVGWATVADIGGGGASEPTITIGQVAQLWTDLAATTGAGSTAARTSLIAEVTERATEEEADFLRRLFIGDLRQGALGGVMADAIAKASGIPAKVIRRGAMLSGDLTETARIALMGDRAAVEAIGLEVMRPVLPMLASTAASAAEAVADLGESSVEWKLDGIRIQVHRQGDDVQIVTRNLNDVTDRLPEIVAAVQSYPCESVILDGEAIGWFGDEGPQAFQDTASRFGRESQSDHQFSLAARFFDILHLDGADLIDRPLRERLDALKTVAGDHAMPGLVTDDPAEAQEVFDHAVGEGHEGVMVKAIDSRYDAGRRGKAWRKVKPVHTLDLVVLAAEWGHGRRTGLLSNLHLGARDGDDFVMVGKTFKGLTDALLAWQTDAFLKREVERDRHIVYIRPELVVEIALDGAQRSTRYAGGVALRFARVRQYRDDKTPAEADTLDAVRELL